MNILSSPNVHLRAWSQFSRRAALGLAVGALGGVGVPISLAAAAKARPKWPGRRPTRRRRPRYKVLTRTFHSGSAIVINDKAPATPYPSTINVAGLKHGILLDLNVTLDGFSHGWPQDIDLLLVAPNGASAVILSDVGDDGSEVRNLTVVLDDQAPLPPNESLVSGRYQPSNEGPDDVFPSWPGGTSPNVALATFRGLNPNGSWKLFVVDDLSGDTGSIAGWSLTIRVRVRVRV